MREEVTPPRSTWFEAARQLVSCTVVNHGSLTSCQRTVTARSEQLCCTSPKVCLLPCCPHSPLVAHLHFTLQGMHVLILNVAPLVFYLGRRKEEENPTLECLNDWLYGPSQLATAYSHPAASQGGRVMSSTTSRPGRHLACVLCRDRKVKCDGGKPSCDKCIKAGETCSYTINPKASRAELHQTILQLNERIGNCTHSLSCFMPLL